MLAFLTRSSLLGCPRGHGGGSSDQEFKSCSYSVGESVDISDGDTESVALTEASGQTLREKMVYMSVGDSHHSQGNHSESCGPNKLGRVVNVNIPILPFYLLFSRWAVVT